TSAAVALRLVCNAGNATFTTVPSINAMLDARMVAARIQRPRVFEQGAAARPDRIMFSSQASWRTTGMFVDTAKPHGPASSRLSTHNFDSCSATRNKGDDSQHNGAAQYFPMHSRLRGY